MKKFIVIDGFDGSGKDTQSQFVYGLYKNKVIEDSESTDIDSIDSETSDSESNERVILRSHPESDNYFGKKAHKALLKEGKINKIIATIFYIFDVIRSLIIYYNKSDVLIFSRYLLAVAYFPKILVKLVYGIFRFILPTSTFMFYLDLPPEIAMERINSRNKSENQGIQSFENLESLRKSREKVGLISSDWIKIDGSKDKNDIKEEIENILCSSNKR